MVSLEELSDDELEQFQKQFRRMRKEYAVRTNSITEVARITNIKADKESE